MSHFQDVFINFYVFDVVCIYSHNCRFFLVYLEPCLCCISARIGVFLEFGRKCEIRERSHQQNPEHQASS